jgi:hypothetical protein
MITMKNLDHLFGLPVFIVVRINNTVLKVL